jgi:endonuclease/exonuclease/phosphatase (EEP) superfamily protein YafD
MPFYRKQVQRSRVPLPKKVIRLLICNVYIENRKVEKLLKLIDKMNPDIVVLAEPDDWWAKEVADLEKKYPHTVLCPLDNAYGMLLYSRLKLIEPELKFLIEDDIPSIHTGVELPSGDIVRLYCLHPRPPAPQESLRSTERDAELLMVGRMTNEHDLPTIICGDLNDVAWSRTTKLFQKISGLLDPRRGRGLYNSFHAHHLIIRFPLDHVFHSNHFRLVELKRLPDVGSDHFPMYVSLSYETTAEMVQESL